MRRLICTMLLMIIAVIFVSLNSCKSDPSSSAYKPDSLTYAGKVYHEVKIGTQTWLEENLDVGTMIPGSASPGNNETIEKHCYNDLPANCNIYGGLYQWSEAMAYNTTPGTKGICPEGWHIPTQENLQTLALTSNTYSNALKARGQGIGNGTGSNSLGFSAKLAGTRNGDGVFEEIGVTANFWSSTQEYISIANSMMLYYANSGIYFYQTNKSYSYSIRCIKD